MDEPHADQMLRTAKALRSSLLVVLQHIDDLCDLVESRGAPVCGGVAQGANRPRGSQGGSELRVDRSTLTISWMGRECYLGYTLPFRLLERLAQRPNQFIQTDRLMEELWAGIRAQSTVRSAVSELRTKLVAAGMADLAELIDGRNPGHYGLMLARRESNSNRKPTAVRR